VRARRLALLLPAGLALVLGVNGGLGLLGLPSAPVSQRLPDVHGFLLVLGFVGTLVALERAVALRRPLGFAAPALLGAGGLVLVSALPLRAGQSLLVAGVAALLGVYFLLWRRQRDDAVLVQALGAVLALGAAVLWLGGVPVPRLLPWLAGFVVLTIAGERLELARLEMAGAGTPPVLLAGVGALVCTVVATLLWPDVGYPALGLVLLGLVVWLGSHDVARRTVRASGLPRFVAACLLAGYAWLATAGLVWALSARVLDGPAYDAAVHAVFVGFTLSMIMAHAPVILPAVLRVSLPYHPAMYVPAALLHASLLVRLAIGDARDVEGVRQAGGALGAAAIGLLIGVLVWSATRPTPIGTARATRAAAGPPAATRSDAHVLEAAR